MPTDQVMAAAEPVLSTAAIAASAVGGAIIGMALNAAKNYGRGKSSANPDKPLPDDNKDNPIKDKDTSEQDSVEESADDKYNPATSSDKNDALPRDEKTGKDIKICDTISEEERETSGNDKSRRDTKLSERRTTKSHKG